MSPDNWKSNPVVARLIKTSTSLQTALPNIGKLLLAEDTDLRGLTVFLGDTAEFVGGLRSTASDGTPTIIWSSGATPLELLINLDKAVGTGNFKVDKKALTSSPPTTT